MDPAFAERRGRLGNLLGPRSALLLASPPERLRNGDVHYKFRQNSDILYLTGLEEPGTVVVLRPDHPETPFVLFVRPRSPVDEIWTGRRAGVEGAIARFGANAAFPIGELEAKLPEILSGVEDVHVAFGHDEDWDARVLRVLGRMRAAERRGQRAPLRLVDARLNLHEMRLIKSDVEIAQLRRAADITAEAHTKAMRAAKGGVGEHEIEALIDYTFRRHGGTGPGYPSIVGGGVNAVILHYVENNASLEEGQLLLVDAGCEVAGGFTADVTRTFPIGRPFSPAQRRVYEAVLDVQIAAIEAVRPGATIDAIHTQVVEQLTRKMVDLGLLEGDVAALVEKGAYKTFYMHRTSHWLGLDVHDVGFYSIEGAARPLTPGMVLTIEPGLYIAEDAAAPPALRGIGVRIEDDILVTASGYENLTRGTPKSVAEIESLVSA
ncbi:MAG: aminopeptidase P N-terminal domain-containing protein [Deltaproteobacteria bacterium]|nr:aminopeptidase P N-terminal domain-containing protein [Deltaproteobacteria bacterium]